MDPNSLYQAGADKLTALLKDQTKENLQSFFETRTEKYPMAWYEAWGETFTFADLEMKISPDMAGKLVQPAIELIKAQNNVDLFETAVWILGALLKKASLHQAPSALVTAWPNLMDLQSKFNGRYAPIWLDEIQKRYGKLAKRG